MKMDMSGLPDWVQSGLSASGTDTFSYYEGSRILFTQQFALIFIGLYVSKQRFGDRGIEAREQERSNQIRTERRKRSGLGRPKTLEDINFDDTWLDDKDGQDEK